MTWASAGQLHTEPILLRRCRRCPAMMGPTDHTKDTRRPYRHCAECRAKAAEAIRARRAANPGYGLHGADTMRDYHRQRREMVLAHYGGHCVCCGESTFEFLALDHVGGGGNKHRQAMGGNGSGMIGLIIAAGFPATFQIKCHNCNLASGFYGQCPHEAVTALSTLGPHANGEE